MLRHGILSKIKMDPIIYFDSISDEEKEEVDQRLKEVGF